MSEHVVTWFALLAAIIACYGLKVVGYLVPERLLHSPRMMMLAGHITIALLAGLVVLQTFESSQTLVVDARLAGLVAAVVLLFMRAPFLVVVIGAALVAAGLRWLGWMV